MDSDSSEDSDDSDGSHASEEEPVGNGDAASRDGEGVSSDDGVSGSSSPASSDDRSAVASDASASDDEWELGTGKGRGKGKSKGKGKGKGKEPQASIAASLATPKPSSSTPRRTAKPTTSVPRKSSSSSSDGDEDRTDRLATVPSREQEPVEQATKTHSTRKRAMPQRAVSFAAEAAPKRQRGSAKADNAIAQVGKAVIGEGASSSLSLSSSSSSTSSSVARSSGPPVDDHSRSSIKTIVSTAPTALPMESTEYTRWFDYGHTTLASLMWARETVWVQLTDAEVLEALAKGCAKCKRNLRDGAQREVPFRRIDDAAPMGKGNFFVVCSGCAASVRVRRVVEFG